MGSLYFKLSKENKKKVKRPIHPHDPYVRLIKNNKVFYKLRANLTNEDKLLTPPPPPVPNASKEEILKAKKAYDAWKERTGNDFAVPPPPPPIKKTSSIKFKKANSNQEFLFTEELNRLTELEKARKINQNETDFIKSIDQSNDKIYVSDGPHIAYSLNKLTKEGKTELTKDKNYFLDGKAITFEELIKIESQKIKSIRTDHKNINVILKTPVYTKKNETINTQKL
ncbi:MULTISPECIES: hypothetical protein [unclassified Polaribacter]|uniref:hypothetical protein n=1 Tax=unclassified Polaribacter TaxID=196858 RepID=UPI0011BDA3D9|nr:MULTISPECIES: hypothetical protein [unclassified Polaribacter]TXD51002.1 hypothetical protein ES043_13900 [Polaribacter sp. IC063]TXD57974.1 hypothetical protein ES044_13460 [Polaribacter sp. IC066]